MTGLLTGTNKFKNFEIETNLKVSVLNSPYLEGRRYVYKGGGNVTPTPQVGNITITRNGTEITLVPPAKFYAITGTDSVLTVTDTENNPYAISKVYKSAHGINSSGRTYECIDENNSWNSPAGPAIRDNKVIVVVDAYDKSPEVIQPELIDWLEAQGFAVPIPIVPIPTD